MNTLKNYKQLLVNSLAMLELDFPCNKQKKKIEKEHNLLDGFCPTFLIAHMHREKLFSHY